MSCGWIGLSLVEGSRAMTMDIWYDLIPLSSDVKLTIICITVLVYTASLSPNSLNSYTEKKKKKDLGQVGLVSVVIAYVGNGNFHAMLLFTTDEKLEIAQKAAHRIVRHAIEMDANSNIPMGTAPAPLTTYTIFVSYPPTTTSTTWRTGVNLLRISSPADGKSSSKKSICSEKLSVHGCLPPSSLRHLPMPTIS